MAHLSIPLARGLSLQFLQASLPLLPTLTSKPNSSSLFTFLLPHVAQVSHISSQPIAIDSPSDFPITTARVSQLPQPQPLQRPLQRLQRPLGRHLTSVAASTTTDSHSALPSSGHSFSSAPPLVTSYNLNSKSSNCTYRPHKNCLTQSRAFGTSRALFTCAPRCNHLHSSKTAADVFRIAATPVRWASSSASQKRDPYEVLSLKRDASTIDIKKKYAQLAKTWHPDVNMSENATAKMSEVSEAYQILVDPEKRKMYDTLGLRPGESPNAGEYHSSDNFGPFSGFDFSSLFNRGGNSEFGTGGIFETLHRPVKGSDVEKSIQVDFMEAIFGCNKTIRLAKVAVPCQMCGSSGCASGTSPTTCTDCNGSGVRQRSLHNPSGANNSFIMQTPCSTCQALGKVIKNPCQSCGGSGVVFEAKQHHITIPAGVDDGMVLLLSGMGHSAKEGIPPGDLRLLIRVLDHPVFTRIGNDIHVTAPLSISQSVVGGTVNVTDLMSNKIPLKLLPGRDKPGSYRVLLKQAHPLKGNIIVHFEFAQPPNVTARYRELLKELDAIDAEVPTSAKVEANDAKKKEIEMATDKSSTEHPAPRPFWWRWTNR